MIAGWLLVALFPVLPGQKIDIRAVVFPIYSNCTDKLGRWGMAGAKILIDCKKIDGTEKFVIMPEDYQ